MSEAPEQVFQIRYQAERTPASFHASNAFFRGLMGPVGSGKSVATGPIEILRRSMEQAPFEGVRRSRWLVVRNSYPELESTTIKTWRDWIPEPVCHIRYSHPITGSINIPLPDGTRVEAEVVFLALDRPEDMSKLLSLEFTGAWLNEAREIPKEIVDGVSQRAGRYPSRSKGGPSWYGFWGDTNPPATNHWWCEYAEYGAWRTIKDASKLGEWKFFRQPGGLLRVGEGQYAENPLAENVANLPGGYDYYWRMLSGKMREWIDVYILALYGSIFTGKPVYDGYFSEQVHVAPEPLAVCENIPLRLHFDFGLTPAAVLWQLAPWGQMRIYREFCTENASLRELCYDVISPSLQNDFAGHRVKIIGGDPAGRQRSQVDLVSCFDELKVWSGIDPEPAQTNEFTKRRAAVIARMNKMAGLGRPGFLLDPSCRMLREGFGGGYQFSRIQTAGADKRFRTEPLKNEYSHPHDALQYAALSIDEVAAGGIVNMATDRQEAEHLRRLREANQEIRPVGLDGRPEVSTAPKGWGF